MPADPTHNPTFRRASRKQEDDIEARRARGEVSAPMTSSGTDKLIASIDILCRMPAVG
jgi:hypothetical protein